MITGKTAFRLFVLLLGALLPLSADMSYSLGGVYCDAISQNGGLCTPYTNNGASTITFDKLDPDTTSSGYLAPDSVSGPVKFEWAGSVSPFVSGSSAGNYAAPGATSTDPNRRDQTQYLTIGSPGLPQTVTVTFLKDMYYFGFYMGSPDTYNNLSFTFSGISGTQTFTGAQLIPPGDQSWAVGEFVNFFAGDNPFTTVTMSSTQAAFETDNYAYADHAVPEPGAIFLLGTAILGIAVVARRRLV